jgi:hypothetical protein
MGVAVCSVCDLPIHGAVYAGKNGGDVHIRCVPSISIDSSAHKEVRPRFLDFKEFLPMLFFKILLSNMPLERVAASRSGKCKARGKPATVHPKEFHRVYAKTWQSDVGTTPSLCNLRDYAYKFLMEKCDPTRVEAAIANPEVSYNEFEWNGFYIDEDEIIRVVQNTVRQYSVACMGNGWDECYESFSLDQFDPWR